MAGFHRPALGGSSSAWAVPFVTDWTGNDTDFLTGGHGTTATFEGVTFTAHINQASGNGANKFESGDDGLEIDPDYQTRLVASASNPEWPGLWALVKDLLGGSWNGRDPVVIQARIEFGVAPAANFESGGIVLWDPSEDWFVWVHPSYNGAESLWMGRKTPTNSEYKPSMSLPNLIEVHLYGGLLVDVFHGTWGGSWPTPGTLNRATDASFNVKGDVTPGSSSNRPVDPDNLRLAVCATNNNSSRNIEMTCPGLRVLKLQS